MEKLVIFIKLLPKLKKGIYVLGGIIVMAGHNVINPHYIFASITHSYTFIKKGPRIRNTKAVWLFSLRIIGKADILFFLQGNDNGFLIYHRKLGEVYASIN